MLVLLRLVWIGENKFWRKGMSMILDACVEYTCVKFFLSLHVLRNSRRFSFVYFWTTEEECGLWLNR